MDNELFELCKSVYEATGWYGRLDNKWVNSGNGKYHVQTLVTDEREVCPFYTSDYLLEKLPPTRAGLGALTVGTTDGTRYYLATYMDRRNGSYSSLVGYDDTPLKALLKLTLALSETGELKG